MYENMFHVRLFLDLNIIVLKTYVKCSWIKLNNRQFKPKELTKLGFGLSLSQAWD